MKFTLFLLRPVLLIIAAGFLTNMHADSWSLPTKEKYCSANAAYCVEVTPKELESQLQYFKDKVENKDDAGAQKGIKNNRPTGTFYARNAGGGYSLKMTFRLVNEVAPVSALVSDDGEFFVTFDNWHSVGYGNDVVVIYRTDGTLVRKFALEELFTEGDIGTFTRTISSRHWGGEHYLDKTNHLVLKAVSNGDRPANDNATYYELKISLATGQPLEPKVDRLHQRVFITTTSAASIPENLPASTTTPKCLGPQESMEAVNVVRIPSEQFHAKAIERTLPTYPAIAQAAHAGGTVVVEVLVAKTGEVLCARAVSGHPLLRSAAQTAALKWKFQPFEISGGESRVVGSIAMNFGQMVKRPKD